MRIVVLLTGIVLVAAACSSGDDFPSEPASDGPTTVAALDSPTVTTTSVDATEPPTGPAVAVLGFDVAEGWTATVIGEGVKPVLALDPAGMPGVAYLLEDLQGFIAYASLASDWQTETVTEGYFYGPIGLAYTPDGIPYIAYHDHQETSFVQDLGDLTIAFRNETNWQVEAVNDDGHDGWDSTIAIGVDGIVRAAGIDPQQFDRQSGVEYVELTAGGWEVTEIGSGPIAYEYNVSLAIGPDGEPGLTYYDNNAQTLQYATRNGDSWVIETVDDSGDVGRYSSLAYDSLGNPHITYVDLTGATTATVRYATQVGRAWEIADVTQLTAVLPGFTGARRITQVAIDGDDRPHIVYGDESIVGYARRDGAAWTTETVAEAGELRLGQLVSFALTQDGRPHLAMFEVTNSNPLNGTVAYLTTA